MDSVLVDTDVLSYAIKGDTRAARFERHLTGRRACVSFMTVAELYRWTVQRRWGRQRVEDLRARLARFVVLPYDEPTAWEWARASSIPGRPVPTADAWIAATALRHGLPLVTANPRHYEPIPGLVILTEA